MARRGMLTVCCCSSPCRLARAGGRLDRERLQIRKIDPLRQTAPGVVEGQSAVTVHFDSRGAANAEIAVASQLETQDQVKVKVISQRHKRLAFQCAWAAKILINYKPNNTGWEGSRKYCH